MKSEFILDPEITYLNHGSYGATPKIILQEQRRWQEKLEREPVQFMLKTLPAELENSRSAVAQFLGIPFDTVFFVSNATSGVQTILMQRITKGMNVVCTSHRYQAVYNSLHHVCNNVGATLVEIDIPFGMLSPKELEEHIWNSIPKDCDFFLIDEISSATAIRFPVQRIVHRLKIRNPLIEIFVDGAHSPGHIVSDYSNIDYWTGNLQKWCCAPKGVAVLYVRKEKQDSLHALVISHGYNQGFDQEMAWMGTHDPSAVLCTPVVLTLHEEWGGKELRACHHALMREARSEILTAFPYFTVDESVEGLALSSFRIPFREGLYETLFAQYNIEVFIQQWGEDLLLRISCFSAYNTISDYRRLIAALRNFGY
jgi:isopenicillin-N epimerase